MRAMARPFINQVRLSSSERSKLLCRLDEAEIGQRGRDRRRWKRWEYRVSDIALLVQHPGGGTGRYLVCARNLSAGGISFIHGGYLHPGSDCRVMLPRHEGGPLVVGGVVAHCRHVGGAHHEVGIQFVQEVDPTTVLPQNDEGRSAGDQSLELPSLKGDVLVIDQSKTDRRLMSYHLGATGLNLVMAESCGAALQAVGAQEFDVVLCDLNLEGDVVKMISDIRRGGFRGPVIVMTAENSAARLAEARAAGANEIIGKPFNPISLASLLAEWLKVPPVDQPIYSSLESKPGMAELIADFIADVQGMAKLIEKAVGRGDVKGLREKCLGLMGSGSGHGFEPLTEAARDALTALDTTQSPKDAVAPLRRVVSVCRRLRCGNSVRPLALDE